MSEGQGEPTDPWFERTKQLRKQANILSEVIGERLQYDQDFQSSIAIIVGILNVVREEILLYQNQINEEQFPLTSSSLEETFSLVEKLIAKLRNKLGLEE